MTIYLDCNATTPVEPKVQEEVFRYMAVEFGNAGSRTHEYGARAKQAVERARDSVAAVAKAKRDEVIFTSGATESNNLVILGLAPHGEKTQRRHIVSTQIEHKAVLEPLEALAGRGFEITLVPPTKGGWVDAAQIKGAVRDDTLLVSVMQINNETGVIQPVSEIAEMLREHPSYIHVDAAQGFGKEITPLQNQRIDFISVSGHKVYAPKGVGALVARRRGFDRPPLTPLFFGGGQERGLRPGTLPVPLIVGLGLAAELALKQADDRSARCREFRLNLLEALKTLEPVINGDVERASPHVLNVSFPGVDSEALMVALKDCIAVSNGSACTSQSYQPSHVLKAMGLPESVIKGAVRFSWCHMTEIPDWNEVVGIINKLR
ncbi:MAG TPA: cysteine desulfurase DndA [Pyrinomonadaceae bacterium]|nr:cysteine desulfurase DndA [Pyrinomonadaceae bacterium]